MNVHPHHPRPLRMPYGSVRALVAIMAVAVVIYQTVRAREISLLLSETLIIVLAHYFASRRLMSMTPVLRLRLEQEGVLDHESNPLWLPRNTVRAAIVLAFIVLAGFMAWRSTLLTSPAMASLGLVFAYLGGVIAAGALHWWLGRRAAAGATGSTSLMSLWVHGKAIAALAAISFIVARSALDWTDDDIPRWLNKAAFATILFYFGSR